MVEVQIDDSLFREELAAMEQKNHLLKIVHVISRQDSREDEKGHVDTERLKKFVSDFGKRMFFICGPPAMMKAVNRRGFRLG